MENLEDDLNLQKKLSLTKQESHFSYQSYGSQGGGYEENESDNDQFGFDKNLLVLKTYKWNCEVAKDKYFSQQEQIDKKLGFDIKDNIVDVKQFLQQNPDFTCETCLCDSFQKEDEVQFCSFGHGFCTQCWRTHIQQNIQKKQVFFTCMKDGCQKYVYHTFIMQNTDQIHNKLYQKYLGMNFVEDCSTVKYCPQTDCDYCAEDDSYVLKTVKCPCGKEFCFRCSKDIHFPAQCGQVKQWIDEISKDDANLKFIALYTKWCPNCKIPTQKEYGCNYLRCKCGTSFCYGCGGLWPDDSDGSHHRSPHMSCQDSTLPNPQNQKGNQNAKPAVDGNTEQQKLQEALKIYNKSYDNFLTREKAALKAHENLQNICPVYREIIFQNINIPLTETEFIQKSFQILIKTNVTLQWSYCFGFYKFTKKNENFKELFEFTLQELTESCNALIIFLLKNVADFINVLKNSNNENRYQLTQDFFSLKDKINIMAQKIDKANDNMVNYITNNEDFDY